MGSSIALTAGQHGIVFNILSFGLVSMLACTIYTLVSQSRVLPKYRTALVMSSMVTFIAAYHYMRIFNSFEDSFVDGKLMVGTGAGTFNEAYRYVDWILTFIPSATDFIFAIFRIVRPNTHFASTSAIV